MNKRLQKLLAQRTQALAAMRTMLDAADVAGRELTAEEATQYAAHETTVDTLNASIDREQKLAEHERTVGAVGTPGARPAIPVITGVHTREQDQPFASLGEQLVAIATHFSGKGTDPRLFGADPSGAGAGSGPDGAFMVQKDFALDLVGSGIATGVLSSRCSQTPIGEGSDSLEVVTIDETSRATGSRFGGVQVFRRKDADTVNSSKVKFGKWERRLEDMMGLAYATERLLQDAPALGSVFSEAYNEEFGFMADLEIFAGTGVGECLGITKSDAFVAVPEVNAQAAGTVVAQNILDIWARVPSRNRLTGIWLYNQALESQLPAMTIGAGAGIIPIFLPPGGLSGSQYSTIFGRPAMPIEQAEVPGTAGDLGFYDLTQYKLITKGGVQEDQSIHVRFIYGERTFRWMTRFNGAPKWKTARTPFKGANKISPFVGIATRA